MFDTGNPTLNFKLIPFQIRCTCYEPLLNKTVYCRVHFKAASSYIFIFAEKQHFFHEKKVILYAIFLAVDFKVTANQMVFLPLCLLNSKNVSITLCALAIDHILYSVNDRMYRIIIFWNCWLTLDAIAIIRAIHRDMTIRISEDFVCSFLINTQNNLVDDIILLCNG